METKLRLAFRLKTLRKQAGLTQLDLSERMEMSVDAISNLERGKSLPSFSTIEKLSRTFDVPLKSIFDFDADVGSRRKAELVEEMTSIARGLTEADLELALEQLKALNRRRSKPQIS